MVYDRLTGKSYEDKDLPRTFALGRFVYYDTTDENKQWDISNYDTEQFYNIEVNQLILDDIYKYTHELLSAISINFNNNPLETFPIIQNFDVGITQFEKLLISNLEKLCAIGADPHSLLDRNTVKVNIGRAKRISKRSYQHLAHHSEDWEKMSFLNPKPRRILNEELTVDYCVYENIFYKYFLQQTIRYLNSRIKQTADITNFFEQIFNKNSLFHNLSSLQKNRYRALIGRAQEKDDTKISSETHDLLVQIRSELNKLSHLSVFEEISNRQLSTFVFHDTNVLNNHKYYKYLKILWVELLNVKDNINAQDFKSRIDMVMKNLRTYVVSLFVYTLVKVMGYDLKEQQSDSLKFVHKSLPKIEINIDKWDVIKVATEFSKKRVVVLGGFSEFSETIDNDIVVFCFSDYLKQNKSKNNIYFINPIDAGSIEYSGIVIRQIILNYYSFLLKQTYPFAHNILEYIRYLPSQYLAFDINSFEYRIRELSSWSIDHEEIIKKLHQDSNFKKKNRKEQNSIKENLLEVIRESEESKKRIVKSLVCPNCGSSLVFHSLSYMTCKNCNMLIIGKDNSLKLCFENEKTVEISSFPKKEQGMDFVFES